MKFQSVKGNRVKHNFIGFTTQDKPKENTMWFYNETLKKWESGQLNCKYDYSSHCPCNSLRAFRRKLKRAPKGILFTLVSRYKNQDISVISK